MPVDQAVRDKVAERYPSHTWLLDLPEISDLFAQAVDQEWTPELLKSKIEATQWWRSRSDKVKQWVALENTNPGEATNRINDAKQQIIQLSTQLGQALSDNEAGALAWAASREGWNAQQLRQAIAARVQPSTTKTGMTDVRKLADAYMVSVDDNTVMDLTRKVFTGELDENGVTDFFREMAASRFPTLGEWIKKGVAPGTYFAPYKNLISQYTDTPEGQIDLVNDPTWQRIISNPVPDGPPRPMSIAEATSYIRSTRQFAESNTGKREAAAFRTNFEQLLGVRA